MGGWFVLVGSQRSSATSLEAQIADAQVDPRDAADVDRDRQGQAGGEAGRASRRPTARRASWRSCRRRSRRSVEMPSLLLQMQRLAGAADVSLESFAPSSPTPLSGYDSIPIDVTVTGRYRAIQRFVHDLRTQAGSVKGRVHADGRLFSVETVGITAAPEGLPNLTADDLARRLRLQRRRPADRVGSVVHHNHRGGDSLMSTVTKSWAPTKSDPVAAAARKKKVLLVVLVVLLAGILAFEVPRLMHRSGSAPPPRPPRRPRTASRPASSPTRSAPRARPPRLRTRRPRRPPPRPRPPRRAPTRPRRPATAPAPTATKVSKATRARDPPPPGQGPVRAAARHDHRAAPATATSTGSVPAAGGTPERPDRDPARRADADDAPTASPRR